jgi:Uma2 family endonuclease
MAAPPQAPVTPEQYLEFERASLEKHEYYRGEIFAMAGRSPWHSLIAANFISNLSSALKDSPCRVMTSDLRILVPGGFYTYPDISVVCGEMKFSDKKKDTIENPSLVVEVLSPSTEAHDRGFKATHYRQIASLQEYVFVSQTEARLERYRREPNDDWKLHDIAGLDAVCDLVSVGCAIPLAGIYAKVDFDAAK